MVRITKLLTLRLRVGSVMLLLALVPMIGLAGFAGKEAVDIIDRRAELNDVEAASEELLVFVALEAAVVDEIYWSGANRIISSFGIPQGFVTAAYGFDLEDELLEAQQEVDQFLAQAGDSQLTQQFNAARRDSADAPLTTSSLSLFEEEVLRPLVDSKTIEVIDMAAGLEGATELVRTTQLLDRSNALRSTLVDLITAYFYVAVFGADADPAAARQLSDLRANYDRGIADVDGLVEPGSNIDDSWDALRSDEATLSLLRVVDTVLLDPAFEPVVQGDELDPSGLGNLAEVFNSADEAATTHEGLLEVVATDLKAEVETQRSAADQRVWFVGSAVLIVSIITIASAVISTRSIVQPLTDLANVAELLRAGDNSASVGVRGPSEVRTVAETLNEAVANLRRAETQALALADGRLDDLAEEEVATGTLGASLATAVERLRVSLGEREEYRRRLAHEASHDGLTGVPNRSASLEHLQGALARAQRAETDVAVLFVDLDNFKQVNDLRGHAAGDRLLREVASRLIRSCRDGDLVGRIGGDEFLVIAEPVADEDEAKALSERLLETVCAPFDDGDGDSTPSASIGAALAGGRLKASDVIHDADLAVYEAKEAGRGRTAFCDDEMRSRLLAEADLESAIRHGLEADEFSLHFQPTFNLATGELDGAEALLRWEREGVGQIRPERFIEFAERTDLISEIDSWVMRRGLQHLASWQDDDMLSSLHLAVNVSGRHLLRGDLSREVRDAIEATGANPKLLTVEVTESALLDDFATAAHHLTNLREMGIQIAIDDFGTGYTSLSHLRRLPVDILKVDRTFTSNLHRSDDLSLVKLVIETGHLLGHEVTVEGVEGVQQEDILRGLGADRLQGYRFGRPMPENDLRGHLGRAAAGTLNSIGRDDHVDDEHDVTDPGEADAANVVDVT